MPLQKLPVQNLDDINHRRRARETLNHVLDHSFDDSRVQTPGEVAAGVTPVNKAFEPPNVRRYGADNTGVNDCAAAVRQCLLANSAAYFPPGVYLIASTIVITGDVVVIRGEFGGGYSAQSTLINWTGSGSLFSATGTEFGGIYIGHFQITGGSGDGEYAIQSTRPQARFEYLHFEQPSSSVGFDNPGIKLSSASQGSWGAVISNCKWVGPNTASDYRGYYIDIDGGNVDLDMCLATRGSVGCEIIKGETIRLHKCNFNAQDSTFSSESDTDGQCAVRISGTASKKAVKIDACYLEGSTCCLWIETVEVCRVSSTYMDDLGAGNKVVRIRSSASENVTIDGCHIRARLGSARCIENAGANTTIKESFLVADADSSCSPIDNTGTQLVTIGNSITGHASGAAYTTTEPMVDMGNRLISGSVVDTNGIVQYMFPSTGAWTPAITGSVTAGTNTYSTQQGTWVFNGRRVTCDFVIAMTAKDAAMAGNIRITGLPFQSRSLTISASGVSIASYDNIDLSAGKSQLTAVVSEGTTFFNLIECGDNVGSAAITDAAINATTTIRGTLSYDT